MKADWFGWPIVCAVVLGLLFSGAEQVRATSITIVDFEDLGVNPNEPRTTMNGYGVISRGFHYIPGPLIANLSNSDDLHIVNGDASFLSPYNGTTVGVTHDDVILTKVGGGAFSLQSFDFAGARTDKEVSFTVTGDRDGFPAITQTFNLIGPGCLVGCLVDGKVDGIGGAADFQTFYLNSDWTNLKSVTWTHLGYGTADGRYALDNMVVDQPKTIPEPSTMTLLGLGTSFLLGHGWLARKRVKALARVT